MAEVHISSLVVQVKPKDLSRVSDEISANEFAEVHMKSPEGKVIVTLETPSRFEVTKAIVDFRAIQGVLNVVMVYHQMEDAAGMDDMYETTNTSNTKKVETAL